MEHVFPFKDNCAIPLDMLQPVQYDSNTYIHNIIDHSNKAVDDTMDNIETEATDTTASRIIDHEKTLKLLMTQIILRFLQPLRLLRKQLNLILWITLKHLQLKHLQLLRLSSVKPHNPCAIVVVIQVVIFAEL